MGRLETNLTGCAISGRPDSQNARKSRFGAFLGIEGGNTMTTITKELLHTIERDETLSQPEREALRKLRFGEVTLSQPAERLLRRREVAERLSVSRRTIDRWCSTGVLPRMKLPGRSRSSGVPETAVAALIAGSTLTADLGNAACAGYNREKS
jgi:excisionase family DNA binding protein